MPKSGKSDSNLFAIDHGAIETILGDANAPLIRRNTDLLAAFERMPVSLGSEDDVIRAGRFVKQLKAAVRETAKARLSDGRPFADATATVKSFFQKYEEPLKAALEVVLGRLTDAAVRARPAPDDGPVEEAARWASIWPESRS